MIAYIDSVSSVSVSYVALIADDSKRDLGLKSSLRLLRLKTRLYIHLGIPSLVPASNKLQPLET
jgi:hypothetical protein